MLRVQFPSLAFNMSHLNFKDRFLCIHLIEVKIMAKKKTVKKSSPKKKSKKIKSTVEIPDSTITQSVSNIEPPKTCLFLNCKNRLLRLLGFGSRD
jgi:hypothetical protein